MIGKEIPFVLIRLKRVKKDEEKLDNFFQTQELRLLKLDLITVFIELKRMSLAIKVFTSILVQLKIMYV